MFAADYLNWYRPAINNKENELSLAPVKIRKNSKTSDREND
jgi:hypothetical protein